MARADTASGCGQSRIGRARVVAVRRAWSGKARRPAQEPCANAGNIPFGPEACATATGGGSACQIPQTMIRLDRMID